LFSSSLSFANIISFRFLSIPIDTIFAPQQRAFAARNAQRCVIDAASH
jgi:hypothetical protein